MIGLEITVEDYVELDQLSLLIAEAIKDGVLEGTITIKETV